MDPHAQHGGGGEQLAPRLGESGHMVIDQGTEALGQRPANQACGLGVVPMGRPAHHFGGEGGDEQRDAAGSLMEGEGKPGGAVHGRHPLAHIGRHLLLAEGGQAYLLTQALLAQRLPEPMEWMVGDNGLIRPDTAQPHQTAGAASAGEVVDELEGRGIAPVQIFGDQQQRSLLCVAIQKLAHFPQHALGMGADQLMQQGLALRRRAEPGQLQQPGRGHAAQQGDRLFITTAQLGDGLQHRQIGFTRPMQLHALPPYPEGIRDPGAKVRDQGRLADPGFTRDPDDGTQALGRPLPGVLQTRQRLPPPDKQPQRGRLLRHRKRSDDRRNGGDGLLRAQRADEAIAAAGDGLYEARLAGIVSQQSADIADGSLEDGGAHETMAPHPIEQLILGQQHAMLADQGTQQAKWDGGEGNGVAMVQQPCILFIQFEVAKADMQLRRCT